MRARVHVFYKDSVFDPQGSTVAQSLRKLGFSRVKNVRMGKVLDIELEDSSRENIREEVRSMCDKLLSNPVIESYKIELLEERKG